MRRLSVVLFVLGLISISCNNKPATPLPANLSATPEAKALYSKMWTLIDKGIMFAHQDDILYGVEWKTDGVSDVKQVADDYPAVFGWEIGDLELGNSHSLDAVDFNEIRDGIKWVHANGGINTISWHGNNPLTGGNSWDTTSDQVVKSVLPGGDKHEVFIEMLNKVANFYLSLTDEKGNLIPLIFRPYHEHTGSWFWWGQNLCTTTDYIALWHLTVDYMNSRGLNNILYSYSSAGNIKSADDFLERYPGDEHIDIIGFDIYQHNIEQREQFISSIKAQMEIIIPIARERNKIATLSETGFNTIPDSTWWTVTLWPALKDYPISYVLVWRNANEIANHYYAPYPGQASANDFINFKNLDRVLFLNDIQ